MAPNAFSSAPMDVEAAASSNTHPAGSQEAIAAILGTFLELVERGVTACERIADASERIADAEELSLEDVGEEGSPEEGLTAAEFRTKVYGHILDFVEQQKADRARDEAELAAWNAAHPEGEDDLAPLDLGDLEPVIRLAPRRKAKAKAEAAPEATE